MVVFVAGPRVDHRRPFHSVTCPCKSRVHASEAKM